MGRIPDGYKGYNFQAPIDLMVELDKAMGGKLLGPSERIVHCIRYYLENASGSSTQDISQLHAKGDTIPVIDGATKEELKWLGRLVKVIDERPSTGNASAPGADLSRIIQQKAARAKGLIGEANGPTKEPVRDQEVKSPGKKRA